MQTASETSVLGHFDGAALDHFGVSSRFLRRGERFAVETEGAEHDVAFVFGVEPLQQLLVEGPRGRLQSLDTAWDSAARRGRRRALVPPAARRHPAGATCCTGRVRATPGTRCARTATSPTTRRTTSRPRIAMRRAGRSSVSAARRATDPARVTWPGRARRRVRRRTARRPPRAPRPSRWASTWISGPSTRSASRRAPRSRSASRRRARRSELDVCAPCHARRATIAEGWRAGEPFLDHYRPALLDAGLYHADGQIDDEVYEYGSFVQSRMFAAGVACSDCHDPHSLRASMRMPSARSVTGDEVFADAGAPPSRAGQRGRALRLLPHADAHLHADRRAPRPLASACRGPISPRRARHAERLRGCHAARGAAWAAESVARWRGDAAPPRAHFATVLDAARRGLPGAGPALAALVGRRVAARDRARDRAARAGQRGRTGGARRDPGGAARRGPAGAHGRARGARAVRRSRSAVSWLRRCCATRCARSGSRQRACWRRSRPVRAPPSARTT